MTAANKTTRKVRWDLIRALAVIGGILGIIFQFLILFDLLPPILSLFPTAWTALIPIIFIGAGIAIAYGILGWDIWETRLSFPLFLILGIGLIVFFGNYAGILLIIVAIPTLFGD